MRGRASPGRCREAARALGIRVAEGRGVAAARGGRRVTGVEVCVQAGEGAVLETIACEAVAMSGGWSPVVHLWSHCGGKLAWDEAQAHFAPDPARPPRGADGTGFVLAAGAASGALERRGLPHERATGRGGRRPRRWGSAPATRPLPSPRPPRRPPVEAVWSMPQGRGPRVAGEGIPGFPERREGVGRAAGGAGGICERRACQALHHARDGDRPGEAVERQRPRGAGRGAGKPDPGGRHDDVPAALHAGDLRYAGGRGARGAVQADKDDADGRLARGERRALGAGGRLAAAVLLPPAGRERRGRGHGAKS